MQLTTASIHSVKSMCGSTERYVSQERDLRERETYKMTKKKVGRERYKNRNKDIIRLIERVRVRESEKKRLKKVES